jgi:hypothetical protein
MDSEAQMVTSGTLVIGTGDDDLREGSKATVRIVARTGAVFEQDVAAGARFADRTSFTANFVLGTAVDVADIQRIELAFTPDHRPFMNDDKWWFENLTFTVNDSTFGQVILFDQTVHYSFESVDTWSSGTLPTYTPIVTAAISSGRIVIGTGDDDLRRGSQVWFRFVSRGFPDVTFEVARGARFPDRTRFTTQFTLKDEFGGVITIPIVDIIRIEVSFIPDHHDLMEDDKWWFESLELIVDDGSAAGVVLFDSSVHHKFNYADTWTTGILPTFQQMNESIVQVTDEAGVGVLGAQVFVDDVSVGATDRLGMLLVSPIIDVSQRVIARWRVHEQDYYRSNHDTDSTKNWNYRVYLTNVAIDSTGVATAMVTRSGSNISIVVARTNTLIGVNLLATTEWDATDANLDGFRVLFGNASGGLYNATDGQFFMDHVRIVDSARMWDDSDYRIMADLRVDAYVANLTGGFLGWNIAGTAIYLRRTNPAGVLVHEFGHYGLDLEDEYFDDDPSKQCTARPAGSPFANNMPQASCIMSRGGALKICSMHRDNPHVRGLNQGDMACWDKLVSRYNQPPWKLLTPVDRGGIPGMIQWGSGGGGAVNMVGFLATATAIENIDSANLIGDCALTIVNTSGAGVPDVIVKTRDASGQWFTQGHADKNGQILIVGVHAGDRVRIEESSGSAYEETVPAGAMSLTIILTG